MWSLSYEKFMNMIIYHIIILLLHELVFYSLCLYSCNKSHLVMMNYSFNSQFDIFAFFKKWILKLFLFKRKIKDPEFFFWFPSLPVISILCYGYKMFSNRFFVFLFSFLSWMSHTIQVWELLNPEFLCFILVMLMQYLLNAMLTLSCFLQLMS